MVFSSQWYFTELTFAYLKWGTMRHILYQSPIYCQPTWMTDFLYLLKAWMKDNWFSKNHSLICTCLSHHSSILVNKYFKPLIFPYSVDPEALPFSYPSHNHFLWAKDLKAELRKNLGQYLEGMIDSCNIILCLFISYHLALKYRAAFN